MSLEAYRAVWAVNAAGVYESPYTLLVALALAEGHDGRRGGVAANVRPLAARCGLSHTTVNRALKEIRMVGPFDCTSVGGGRQGASYVLAFHPRDAKPVDNQVPAFHPRDASESLAFHPRDTNVPRVDRTTHAGVAKEHHHHYVVGGGVLSGGTQTENPADLPDSETEAEAERLKARADALTHARAALAGEIEPPPRPVEPPEPWPEGITPPNEIASHVNGARAGLRRWDRAGRGGDNREVDE